MVWMESLLLSFSNYTRYLYAPRRSALEQADVRARKPLLFVWVESNTYFFFSFFVVPSVIPG